MANTDETSDDGLEVVDVYIYHPEIGVGGPTSKEALEAVWSDLGWTEATEDQVAEHTTSFDESVPPEVRDGSVPAPEPSPEAPAEPAAEPAADGEDK